MASKRLILAALISASAFGVATAHADDAYKQPQPSTGRETGGPGYGGVGGMGSIGADGDTLSQEHVGSTGVGINNGLSTANNPKGQPQETPKAGSSVKEVKPSAESGTGGSGSVEGTTTSTTITTSPAEPTPAPVEQDQGIGGSGSTDKTPAACNCTCSNDTEPIPLNNAP